jgi:hypothetical protein
VDLVLASEAVAGMLGTGSVKKLGEVAGGSLVVSIIDRVK